MCAYNPGVQSQAGQFYAQGMSSLGQGIGEGIRGYMQNKLMAGQAVAKFEGALKANPELAQLMSQPDAPADAAKAFAKLQKDGSLGVRDAALLATFADTYSTQKQEQQQKAMREQQMQMQKLQMVAAQSQMEQQKKDEAALAASLRPFTQQGAVAGAAQAGAKFEQLPTQAPQFNQTQFLQDYFQRGGSPNSIDKIDQVLRAFTPPKQPDALAPVKIRTVDERGNPIDETRDKRTGAVIARGPVNQPPKHVLTPDEQAEAAGKVKMAETQVKDASDFLKSVADSAEAARYTKSAIGEISELYAQGATSGAGQEFITKGKALLDRAGIKSADLKDQQQLQAKLNELVFERGKQLLQGQGAVSDFERRALQGAMANPNLTPQANMAILASMKAASDRMTALEEERQKLKEQGVSDTAIHQRLLKMRSTMPLPGIDALNAAANAPAPLKVISVTPKK